MMTTMVTNAAVTTGSPVLDHNAFNDVGDVFASVRDLLEHVEQLFPFDDHDRIALAIEELPYGVMIGAVRLVFETVDFDGMGMHGTLLGQCLQGRVQPLG